MSLGTYVFFQDPDRLASRMFALYMLDIAAASGLLLISATVGDPGLAAMAALGGSIASYALNPFFLMAIILARFYPGLVRRVYALPLLLALALILTLGLVRDGLLGTQTFFVPHPDLGQAVVPISQLLVGPLGLLPRLYLYLSVALVLILLLVALYRARSGQRRGIVFLLAVILLVGATMPLVGDRPLGAILPPLVVSIGLAAVVVRTDLFVGDRAILAAVFGSSGEGLVTCDREGYIQQVNRAAARLTGGQLGEQSAGRPLLAETADFWARVEGGETVSAALGGGLETPFEVQVWLGEDRRRSLLVLGQPLQDRRGRLRGGLLTLRDVSEREQATVLLAAEHAQRLQLAKTSQRLEETLRLVHDAADAVAAAVGNITSAARQQTLGAQEQTAAMAQMAISLEEVRSIAYATASSAREVAAAAQQTNQVTAAGQQAVDQVVGGMAEVQEHVESIAAAILDLTTQAEAIGEIILAVDEIAIQSRLLAVNAAMEAARVGEAGSSFGVVAGEVRRLAEQGRQSTARVRTLLADIEAGVETVAGAAGSGMRRVGEGARLSHRAGEAIGDLAREVAASSGAAAQIAASAGQQLAGVEQVVRALAEIQTTTGQNLAGAQRVEETAVELDALARRLRELVEGQGGPEPSEQGH